MMTKLTVEDMVVRVVGPIEPTGEHYTDKKRLQNLENLLELVDRLVFNIDQLRVFADSADASIALIGKRARSFMEDLSAAI